MQNRVIPKVKILQVWFWCFWMKWYLVLILIYNMYFSKILEWPLNFWMVLQIHCFFQFQFRIFKIFLSEEAAHHPSQLISWVSRQTGIHRVYFHQVYENIDNKRAPSEEKVMYHHCPRVVSSSIGSNYRSPLFQLLQDFKQKQCYTSCFSQRCFMLFQVVLIMLTYIEVMNFMF